MGLPLAIQAHRAGDLKLAEQHYRRAIDQGIKNPTIYQNLGALLRSRDPKQADQIYLAGLSLFPGNPAILQNRANLLKDSNPTLALQLSLQALRQRFLQQASADKLFDPFLTSISLTRELRSFHWSLELTRIALNILGDDPRLLLQLFLISLEEGDPESEPILGSDLQPMLESQLSEAPPTLQAEILLAIAYHHLTNARADQALKYYDNALSVLKNSPATDQEDSQKRQKLIDTNSWNFGCSLLKQQQLEKGWRLYEHGLRTPAEGQQRWQRAVSKPFSASQIPLWRGQVLTGKRLLLLGEQAIGDSMMFLTLLPTLQRECSELGVLVGPRLVNIYRRIFDPSIRVWSTDDVAAIDLSSSYDLQVPLGSICQHRFTHPSAYSPVIPFLQSRGDRSDSLRADYLSVKPRAERLIGISWQGGGRPGRIEKKSTPVHLFEELIKPLPGTRFISLQYGNVAKQVSTWQAQGYDVIYDSRVNALKDMELWLDQVAACDAVVSVANTTIHGAGGLNIPTMCLLSRYSDWRWFDSEDVQRSYWYPSVGILRQTSDGSWSDALMRARAWIESGASMPQGPTFSTNSH